MEDVVARLKRTLNERVRPLLLDRGGDLKFMAFSDGILTLSVEGSPGAAMPIRRNVANLIMRYAPEVREVRLVTGRVGESAPAASLHDAVRRVVDEQINPAVAAHGGFVRLVDVAADTVFIRFEGGCQGCAMAHVTLCQGVEVMIKEQIRGVTAVVDVTDHEGGTQPYFKTRKT